MADGLDGRFGMLTQELLGFVHARTMEIFLG
jgi:hypothetical protein